jgi:mannose-6-phosphate isomerase-like protein (cupin superfamily)
MVMESAFIPGRSVAETDATLERAFHIRVVEAPREVAGVVADTALESGAGVLPGAVGISLLHVYDTETVDGLFGGSPHMHLVCSEGYVVLGGRGSVQTLGARGYDEIPLERGKLVWFGPGLVHRLVNRGGLEILTLMQNAGLPEAGDAFFTFPREVLEDRARYEQAASLEPRDGARPIDLAYARRDLAVEGFLQLRAEFETEGAGALSRFYAEAIRLARERVPRWREVWERKAKKAALDTGAHLEAVEAGRFDHLLEAGLEALAGPREHGRLGMCGTLDVY